jgi:SAM-dependent methyltransferase
VITSDQMLKLAILITPIERNFNRERSSLKDTIDAIEAYAQHPTVNGFYEIERARGRIAARKQAKYKPVLDHIDSILNIERLQLNSVKLHERHVLNDYTVTTTLDTYKREFGRPFTTKLNALVEGSRWMDGGAGEARAMIQYLDDGGRARCTAVAFQMPPAAGESIKTAAEKYEGKFNYISGGYFHGIRHEDLEEGVFDLITDVNGVLYYTETFKEDIERYLDLLKVNGEVFITDPFIHVHWLESTDVPDNCSDFAKWASNIDGVQVNYYYTTRTIVHIKKTKQKCAPPPLFLRTLETNQEGPAPVRHYDCGIDLPNDPAAMVGN